MGGTCSLRVEERASSMVIFDIFFLLKLYSFYSYSFYYVEELMKLYSTLYSWVRLVFLKLMSKSHYNYCACVKLTVLLEYINQMVLTIDITALYDIVIFFSTGFLKLLSISLCTDLITSCDMHKLHVTWFCEMCTCLVQYCDWGEY